MERGKPKKSKKGLTAILLMLFALAGAGAYYWYLPQVRAADEDPEPVLEEGQEYVYAKITSILGNEMEYIVLDAQTAERNDLQEPASMQKGRGVGETDLQEPDSMQKARVAGETDLQEPDSMQKARVAGETDLQESDNIQKARVAGETDSGERRGAPAQNAAIVTYRETDRTGVMLIPVGTEVETKLGTVTTFSRLSNGDIIKMLLQKDDTGEKALIKLWIVE